VPIRIYNTLSRRKEELIPRNKGKIGMYVCGPTVYNYIHIGNGRTYLSFDIIYRYLKYRGYQVTYVRNITDIEDKIINKAREEGVSTAEIAAKYTLAFWEDAEALGLAKPTIEPKATEYIPSMIEMIKELISRGLAYVIDGDVYYEVSKFRDYGKLSHRTIEELRAGERVEVDPRKKNPLDFALWKAAKPGEPCWDSPWGKGRPGWHIECSVMSLQHLGMGFDIHGGGQDLIFPHHENEIAQSEGATGQKPFVRYWLHGGMVNIGEEKMAKSLGNIILVRELVKQYDADILRILALSTHYRSPIDFGVGKLEEAKAAYDRLLNFRRRTKQILGGKTSRHKALDLERLTKFREALSRTKEKFVEAMDDDFNTAAALATVFEFIKEANSFMEESEGALTRGVKQLIREAESLVVELTGVFGLKIVLPEEKQELPKDILEIAAKVGVKSSGRTPREVLESVLNVREEARKQQNWTLADEIRESLLKVGVEIEDTPFGPRWKLKL
jgi:cysteinyl-tRNA synthetase